MHTTLDIQAEKIIMSDKSEYMLGSQLAQYMKSMNLVRIAERVAGEYHCHLEPFGEQIKQSGGWLKHLDAQNATAELEHKNIQSSIDLNTDQIKTNSFTRGGVMASIVLSLLSLLISVIALIMSVRSK